MNATHLVSRSLLSACALPLALGCGSSSGNLSDASGGTGQEGGIHVDATRSGDAASVAREAGSDASARPMEASVPMDGSAAVSDAQGDDVTAKDSGRDHADAADAMSNNAHGSAHDSGDMEGHDSGRDAAKHPDAGDGSDGGSVEAGGEDACGICDRVWVCNGFSDNWVSVGPTACADIRDGTTVATLYCSQADTINYADPNNNDGTWALMGDELVLDYNSLEGTVEIDCFPE